MFKFLLSCALCLLFAHEASARRGYVRTREGRIVEGHMRFGSNTVVVVDAAKGLRAEVELTNLMALGFESEVEAGEELANGPGQLPSAWSSTDVGSVRRAGEAEFRGGIFRIRSTGTNVLAEADSFHFIHKPIGEESELVARAMRVQSSDPWARAGLMMRDGLGAEARHLFLAVSAARGGSLASRERRGGDTTVALNGSIGNGHWLKLKRDGERITALASPDGRRWRIIERMTLRMGEEVHAGLAVVGGREGAVGEAMFERVEEGASLRNRGYVPQVELKSGSQQSGWIDRMDDTALHFDAVERRTPITTRGIALVRFQPVPPKLAAFVAEGRNGVLLTTGEFIEGECGGIANHRVTINSVPLGLKRYDVNNEVLAVVLGKRAVLPSRVFEIRTTDGATWLALGVTLDSEGLLMREVFLGTRRIYLHEIAEVRRAS